MPRSRYRRPLHAATVAAALAAALVSCSTGGGGKPTSEASAPPAEQPGGGAAGDGPIGVSPSGVTTRIDAPPQSTEEQYAQACVAAKDWMGAKGGDPDTLVEPFLKEVQASTDSGPATFRKPWAELNEAQQAAVIVAVRAAADGGC